MAKNELRVFYHDPGSILVLNPRGQMRKLYTPFRVLCVDAVNGRLRKGAWVFVDEVLPDPSETLLYVIGGLRLPYRHFRIQISF